MKRPRFIGAMLAALTVGAFTCHAQTNMVITSFEGNGQLTFTQMEDATEYTVEWASSLDGQWTNTWEHLTHIPTNQTPNITVAVPMFYRVVAAVQPAIGSLQVTLSPASAASSGARWRLVSGGSWHATAYIHTNLSVGNYAVTFNNIAGWNRPSDITVAIYKDQFTLTNAVYTATPILPSDMIAIPGGVFNMGDTKGDGVFANELPTHQVTLSSFHLGETKISKAAWDTVYNWAKTNGYTFEGLGYDNTPTAHASDHPVYNINWFDILKWCNARSERENRVPCYYTSSAQTTPYRQGQVDVSNAMVKWTANGYRLPTEAEWEYAARNGLTNSRFPWGDLINHGYANYYATQLFVPYDNDPSPDTYHGAAWPSQPRTTPVDFFATTAYGIRDMAGNMEEWVWDRYDAYPSSSQTNPHGPTTPTSRIWRGGGYSADGRNCRVARRYYVLEEYLIVPTFGGGAFRVVIGQ